MIKNDFRSILFFSCLLFLTLHNDVWGDDNPFIGTWILESNPEITRVFTDSTYMSYLNGVRANNPAAIGPARYTFDSENIYFTETVQIRLRNSVINIAPLSSLS